VGAEAGPLRTLPLHSASGEQNRMYHPQRVEMEAQGVFLSSYLARGRRDGNGRRLDPVLEAHLRVTPERTK